MGLELLPQPFLGHIGVVLSGHHHGVESYRPACIIVPQGDLRFSVGAEVLDNAFLADLGEPAR